MSVLRARTTRRLATPLRRMPARTEVPSWARPSASPETALGILYAGETEADLQEALRQRCRLLRLPYFHAHSSLKSAAGFPDSVIVRPPDRYPDPPWLLLWELKTESGWLTGEQIVWGTVLRAVQHQMPGLDYRVLRPSSWPQVERVLCVPPADHREGEGRL